MITVIGIVKKLIRHHLSVRRLQVLRVTWPTPAMARLTLTGDSLSEFISMAPDDHVKLLVPPQGIDEPNLPSIEDGRLSWGSQLPRPIARDYTPVRFDIEKRELDLDIVLHKSGVIAAWVKLAQPGTIAGLAGPRGSHLLHPEPQRLVLAGDETALPAIARWLGELQPGVMALALIEVQNAGERQPLPSRANVRVVWVERGQARAGTTDLLLQELMRCELPQPVDHVWLAGEAETVRAMREFLLEKKNLGPDVVSARGYWKLGARDHQEPHED